MSDLKPCPFCTAALVWSDTYGEYHHPVAKCILSGHKFKKGMIGQWNRRALPAVQPDTAPAGNLTARGNAATWALYDANLTRMGALQPAHVNETPKSEHDTANMLTPATKGGDA